MIIAQDQYQCQLDYINDYVNYLSKKHHGQITVSDIDALLELVKSLRGDVEKRVMGGKFQQEYNRMVQDFFDGKTETPGGATFMYASQTQEPDEP